MKYKIFYNKFSNRNAIFKDDFIFDLINILNFEENEAISIFKYINDIENKDIEEDVKTLLEKKIPLEKDNFLEFLKEIQYTLMPNKTARNIVEESLINLVDNVVETTNGYIAFGIQLNIIYQTIGRIFLWENLDEAKLRTPENIREYINDNMKDYSLIYPRLTQKLLNSIDKIDVETNENLFLEYSSKNKYVTNTKREKERRKILV